MADLIVRIGDIWAKPYVKDDYLKVIEIKKTPEHGLIVQFRNCDKNGGDVYNSHLVGWAQLNTLVSLYKLHSRSDPPLIHRNQIYIGS